MLARLYQETNEQAFLDAAIAGVEHLKSIATLEDDAALIYYRSPDFTDLYYLGYCHGPVGTSRTFYLLHEITGDDRYLEWVVRLARGVIRSGVPEMQTPGLWNVVCQCCGTAGIADFFTGLALVTNNEEYLTFAERVAAVTLEPGKRFRWSGTALVSGMDANPPRCSQCGNRLYDRCGRSRRIISPPGASPGWAISGAALSG